MTLLRCLLVASLLAACRCASEEPPPPPEAPPEHQDEPEHEELPDKVRLPEGVLKASGVRVAPVTSEELQPSLDLTGEIAADPDATAVVSSPVVGRLVEVRVRENERVRAGQVVAVVESAELARARSALTAAEARAAAARRNAGRLAGLKKDGLTSGQELANAEAEAQALEAEATAARQSLAAFGAGALEPDENASRLLLRAPIDGVVTMRDGTVGTTVGPDHVIARIANLDKAYFVARLFEKNLGRITVGRHADVRLNAYPNEIFPGVVESIGKQLDPTARTIVARIALRNRRDLLKLGLFGTARVVIEGAAAGEKHLVVPLTAVTRLRDRVVVFVQHPDGDFEVHPVELGTSSNGLVQVLSGLREGEAVVVEGVFTLKSVLLKSTFGEEEE